MASRTEAGLRLTISGASPDELMAGLRAALDVFERSGVSPVKAVAATWHFKAWDGRALDRFSPPSTNAIADVWSAAQIAAITACCRGWPQPPSEALLTLAAR